MENKFVVWLNRIVEYMIKKGLGFSPAFIFFALDG